MPAAEGDLRMTTTLHEPPREIPVAEDVDLCVIGGSCTGLFAAVQAARLGLRTAVVEAQGMLGGTATAGMVCIWHSLTDTLYERQIIGGLTAEVMDRLVRRGDAFCRPRDANAGFVFNPAELSIELDAMAEEAGVRSFLHARFCAPAVEDGRCTAAIIEDKSGRRAIRARFFVDATGDGDLIGRLGLPLDRRTDLQPATLCFLASGIGKLRCRNNSISTGKAVFSKAEQFGLKRGFLWDADLDCVGLGDVRMVAGTRAHDADCSDADTLTNAEIDGRKQVRQIIDILRSYEGGECVRLAALASHIGLRETNTARCLHELTEQEVLDGVQFDDAIANGTYRVDVHHSGKEGITFRYLDGREEYIAPGKPRERSRWRPERDENPTFYQIPYRCLVPQGQTAGNVLAAGRLIDADRGAFGAVRVMVNCNQTGQAAGAAAALALREGCDAADVDPAVLRKTLSDQGAIAL
jgi:hypothetical protein